MEVNIAYYFSQNVECIYDAEEFTEILMKFKYNTKPEFLIIIEKPRFLKIADMGCLYYLCISVAPDTLAFIDASWTNKYFNLTPSSENTLFFLISYLG